MHFSSKLTSDSKMDWYPYQELSLTNNHELNLFGKMFESPRQWHIMH